MRRFILLLTLCGLGSCCGYWDTPLETEVGWTLFGYADDALDTNRDVAMRAVYLDEYCRQTTDEDRRAVQDRYFPRERIVDDGNVWRILTPQYTWTFEMADGKLLAEPGSEWKISYEGNWMGETPKSVIGNSGAGVLTMRTEIDSYRFRTVVQTQFRPSSDSDGGLMLDFFMGDLTLRSKEKPRLDVACTIVSAVKFREKAEYPEPDGVLSLTAHNEADNADEQATARYLADGDVEITYRGATQRWNENEENMLPE